MCWKGPHWLPIMRFPELSVRPVRPVRPARLLLLAILLLASADMLAQSAFEALRQSQQQLQRYQADLAALESAYGPFDRRLLEPLAAMEELYRDRGNESEVLALQQRRLQVLRTELGFSHRQLVPVLEDLIQTRIRLGQWDEVNDHLEHLRFIEASEHGGESEVVLQAMARQANWQLALVYLDGNRERPRRLLQARELFEEQLRLAESIYGADSRELVPWLYARAYNLYQLIRFLNNDSGLAGVTIDELILEDGIVRLNTARNQAALGINPFFGAGTRVPVIDKGDLLGVSYLRQGIGYIDDIEAIAESVDDPELQAMARLYKADFTVLLTNGSARRTYREARELMMEAGLSPGRVDALLARPMPIPVPKFFERFSELAAWQQTQLSSMDEIPAGLVAESLAIGSFSAWEEDLGATARPEINPLFAAANPPHRELTVSFKISSRGQVSSIKVLDHDLEDRSLERRARRALRGLRLRPALVDNRVVKVEQAWLRYFVAVDE